MPLVDLIRTFHVDISREQFRDLLELLADLGDAYVLVEKGKKFLVAKDR